MSDSPTDLVAQGRKLLRGRKFSEAASCFQSAIAANPHDTGAHEAMATVAFITKDYETAATHFREASRCDSSKPQPLINLGAVLNKLQRYKEAIEVLQKGLVKNRNSSEAYYNLGIAYRGAGNAGMAVSAYKEAIRLKSDFAEAHQNLGNAYLDQNNKRQAKAAFTRALELNPELPGARRGLQKSIAVAEPRPLPTGSPRNQNYESSVSAPPVMLTEIQRAADREIVNETAKRIERSLMAFSTALSTELEPAIKKILKAVMEDSLLSSSGLITKTARSLDDLNQIRGLVQDARNLLYEHENELLSAKTSDDR